VRGVPEGYISLVRAFADFQTKRRPDPAAPADFPEGFDRNGSSKQQVDQLKEWYGGGSGTASKHDTPWGSWSNEVEEAHRLCRTEFLEALAQGELKLLYEVIGRKKPRRVPQELFVKVLQESKYENFLGLMFGLACEDEPPQCLQFLPESYEYLNGRVPFCREKKFFSWLASQQHASVQGSLTPKDKHRVRVYEEIQKYLTQGYPNWSKGDAFPTKNALACCIATHLAELAQEGSLISPLKEDAIRALLGDRYEPANRLAKCGAIEPFWR